MAPTANVGVIFYVRSQPELSALSVRSWRGSGLRLGAVSCGNVLG